MDKGELKRSERRNRKKDTVLKLLLREAQEGRTYSIRSFALFFDGTHALGSSHSIRTYIDVLVAQGDVKMFDRKLLCVEGMEQFSACSH